MGTNTDIVQLRILHLIAANAERKGLYNVAVARYLACLDQAEEAGDITGRKYFYACLARCYRIMDMPGKAERYT